MATTVHVFHVRTMHCDDCAALIDDTLQALPGVHNAHATVKTRNINVELDPQRTSHDAVATAITELGFHLKSPATPPPTQPVESVEPQISDPAWRMLEPLLRDRTPNQSTRARDDRQLFEGIAYKHRTGVSWRDVPAAYGPWQTLHERLARWRTDGTWAKVVAAAREADLADELAWVDAAAD